VLGNVYYTIIETAIGAQINGKLLHKANSGLQAPGWAGPNRRPPRTPLFDWAGAAEYTSP
jgi:hypothetical protein